MIRRKNLSLADLEKLFHDEENILTNDELTEVFNERNVSPYTERGYEWVLDEFRSFIKDKNFQLVTELQARRYLDFVEKKKIGIYAKRGRLSKLKSFYNFFIGDLAYLKQRTFQKYRKNLIIQKNPFPLRYKFTGKVKGSGDILELDEIPKYLALMKKLFNYKIYLMIRLMLVSSSRIGGVCDLQINDINWSLRQFQTFDKGKMRNYGFDEHTKQELLNYLKIRNINPIQSDYFFLNRDFQKYHPGSVGSIYWLQKDTLMEELGKRINFTNLRYTFRTHRMVLGQDSDVIEVLMSRKKKTLSQLYAKIKGYNFTKVFDDFDFMKNI